MTSSASTGWCPSFISPPRPTDGSRADPGSACGARLDPQPLEGLRERLRVLEGPAVVVPAGRGPDLGVVARPDDDGLGVETGHVAQVGRDEDPALAVEGRLDGAGEDEPLEEPSALVGDGQRCDLVGQRVPARPRMDRETGVEPAGDDGSALELGAELRRDGDPSLVVHRVPVLAGEHVAGFPSAGWSGSAGWWLCAPLWATFHHFAAF